MSSSSGPVPSAPGTAVLQVLGETVSGREDRKRIIRCWSALGSTFVQANYTKVSGVKIHYKLYNFADNFVGRMVLPRVLRFPSKNDPFLFKF